MASEFDPKLYYYEHVMFAGFIFPAAVLDALKEFTVRRDDVYIVTYPKSGTTWMQQIVSLINGSDDVEAADQVPLTERVPFLEKFVQDKMESPTYKVLETMESPRYVKTHLVKRLLPPDLFKVNPKVVYVARNPKDVLISYYEFNLHPWPWEEFFGNFLKGNVVHGCWFENVSYWWQHREDDNVLFLFYEDLKKDLKGAVRKISDFLNKPLDEDTLDEIARRSSFDVMKENPQVNYRVMFGDGARQLRSGKTGSWKKRLTAAENEAVEEAYNSRLKEIGLQF